MFWSLRDGLGDSLVAAAPYGGPIGGFWFWWSTWTQSLYSVAMATAMWRQGAWWSMRFLYLSQASCLHSLLPW